MEEIIVGFSSFFVRVRKFRIWWKWIIWDFGRLHTINVFKA